MSPSPDSTNQPEAAASRVEQLLDRWEEARDGGEHLSVEDLCAEAPELREELESRIAELKKIDGFLAATETGGDQTTDYARRPAPAAELPATFGDFEILGRIAEGGMGAVYRARQKSPHRVVALKVIRSGDLSSAREVERFHAEANAAAKLTHPGIVPVYEVGEFEGRHYFTMECIDGRSLAQIVRDDGRVPPRQAAEWIRSIARSVHFAHERGVVHRDIKPANVLIDERGEPRVTDFGIARQLDVDTGLTATGQILGTPDYMSPEQAQGQPDIGPAADVFSLGTTFYAMLTGRPPFAAGDVYTTVRRVIDGEPDPPRKLQSGIDKDLETICLKCLNKAPQNRYASAEELAADLDRYLAGETIVARRTPVTVRTARWFRRHPVVAVLLPVVAACTIWGGFLAARYVNYERESVRYFQNTIKRWDVLEGVGEIPAEQARRRTMSVRIVRRGRLGPVLRVEHVNGRLKLHPRSGIQERVSPKPQAERAEARREYEYDASGRPLKAHAYDHTGKRIWSFIYTSPERGHFLDENGLPRSSGKSEVVGVKFDFDENGFTIGETYTDFRGNPRPDLDGSFGWIGEVDERGLQIEITNIGPDGRPSPHKDGYLSTRRKYDVNGNTIEQAYFLAGGRRAIHKDGTSITRFEHDADGNPTVMRYYGIHEQPVVSKEGIFEQRAEFDETGNLKFESYFTLGGEPTVNKYGYHRTAYEYDATGWNTHMRFLGIDGSPVPSNLGFYGIRFEYDEDGRKLRNTTIGRDDRPILSSAGHATQQLGYDDAGNVSEVAFLGTDGKLTTQKDGYAVRQHRHNDQGLIVETRYLDVERRPTSFKDGFHRVTYTYDDRGNLILQEHFGIDGQRVRTATGTSITRQKFDENGRRTLASYYDDQNRPIRTGHGYASWASRHDERGNEIEARFLDESGKLTYSTQGMAGWKREFDAAGRVLRTEFFGLDEKPIRLTHGFAIVTNRYDERGNAIEEAYFDESGKRVISRQAGAAIVRFTVDARGNILTRASFGVREQPVLDQSGVHRSDARFNEHGKMTQLRYFGVRNQPVRNRQGLFGLLRKYDRFGNQIGVSFLGPNGQPLTDPAVVQPERKFDDRGNRVELRFRNGKGELVTRPGTRVAVVRYEYDRFGNETKETHLGVDGKRVQSAKGYAIREKKYNARGLLTKVAYYDSKREKLGKTAGYFAIEYKYSPFGREIERKYLGADEQPRPTPHGYAILRTRHDAYGRQTELAYFDVHDRPTLHRFHQFHKSVRRFDRRGFPVETTKHAIDGKLTNGASGFAREVHEYDPAGWIRRSRYFDASGHERKPLVAVNRQGARAAAALGMRVYDVLVEYDGKPILDYHSFKAARDRDRFDEPRKLVVLRGRERKRVTLSIRPSQPLPSLDTICLPPSAKSSVEKPARARRPALR